MEEVCFTYKGLFFVYSFFLSMFIFKESCYLLLHIDIVGEVYIDAKVIYC